MNDYRTSLVERSSLAQHEAEVLTNLDLMRVLETELVWGPARLRFLQQLIRAGAKFDELPEHVHYG